MGNLYQGTIYGTPFRQFVADSSIPDATIVIGVHIDGVFKEEQNLILLQLIMVWLNLILMRLGAKKISGDYAVKVLTFS